MSEATITGYEPNGLAKWSDGAIRYACFKDGHLQFQARNLKEFNEHRFESELDKFLRKMNAKPGDLGMIVMAVAKVLGEMKGGRRIGE